MQVYEKILQRVYPTTHWSTSLTVQ